MWNRTSARTFLTFGLVLAGAACASDRTYAPPGTVLTDAQVSADVAVSSGIAAANTLQDQSEYLSDIGIAPDLLTSATLGQHTSPVPSANGAPPAPAPATKPSCTYTAATGRWDCAPFTNPRGLVEIRSYAYFDASGRPMQRYDSIATARINYQTSVNGVIGDSVAFTGVTHRTTNETMSGLSGKETTRVWDGFGVSADTNSHRNDGSVRNYAGVRVDSLKALTFAHPRPRGAYPLSGQMVQVANYTVTSIGKTTETRSVSRRIVTTFDGSANATIRVGNTKCTLHLDTRKVDGCTSA